MNKPQSQYKEVVSGRMVTPVGRASHPFVFHPTAFGDDPNAPKKYKTSLLLKKGGGNDVFVKQLREQQDAATKELLGTRKVENWERWGISDGDTAVDAEGNLNEYAKGCWIISCSARNKPAVIDVIKNAVTVETDVYGGCDARLNIAAKAYQLSPNKGGATIEFYVFQKIGDNDAFGNGAKVRAAALAEMGDYEGADPDVF